MYEIRMKKGHGCEGSEMNHARIWDRTYKHELIRMYDGIGNLLELVLKRR